MIVEILRHEIGALSWVGLEINRFRLSACSRDEGEQVVVCCLPLPPSRARRGAHDTCLILCIQAIHNIKHAAGALPDGRVGVLVRRGAAPVLAPRVTGRARDATP